MDDLRWFKSTYSSGNGQCVLCVRLADGGMLIKDSKDPESPVLRFSQGEWGSFVGAIKND